MVALFRMVGWLALLACPTLLLGAGIVNDAKIRKSDSNLICDYDGKNFTQGQPIATPSKPCYRCTCTQAWDENSPNSESCSVVECPWREYDTKYYSRGCQPVYSPFECCPTSWTCPNGLTTSEVRDDSTPNIGLSSSGPAYVTLPPSGSRTQDSSTTNGIASSQQTSSSQNISRSRRELNVMTSSPVTSSVTTPSTEAPATQGTPGRDCPPDVGCPWHQWGHYREKGCEPYYKSGECCPAGFKCPPIDVGETFEADCEYAGTYYKLGDTVNQSSPCQECACSEVHTHSGPRKLIRCEQRKPCGVQIPPGCFPLFKPQDPCCPIDYHCNSGDQQQQGIDSRNTRDVATCEVNGRKFVEGQMIILEDNPCTECVCVQNFTEIAPEGSSCNRVDHCFMMGRDELRRGCIPIYYQGGCCPIEWHCPQKDSQDSTDDGNNATDMCVFDGRSYPLGSGLDIGQQCVTCTCSTPPGFTCVHRKCPEPPNNRCITMYRDGECCPHYQCKDNNLSSLNNNRA